jgi:CRISPR-associated protein Csd2
LRYIDPAIRHEAVMLFDCKRGNPNGDPDAGNLPRMDPETLRGWASDVCLKHKVRVYAQLAHKQRIYQQHSDVPLNARHIEAYEELGLDPNKPSAADVAAVRDWMCEHYYDIRMFGAVMGTSIPAGQVTGPVQLAFAESVDQIFPVDSQLTRGTVTRVEDIEKERTMGRRAMIPYGLYIAWWTFSPQFAQASGVNDEDLEILWSALIQMWDFDRSASRGMMATRGLYVFTHDSALGNAPAHRQLESVRVARRDGVETARDFGDYEVTIDDPVEGVELTALVEARAPSPTA